jgi:NAD(P)H-flavin reductase
MKLNEHDLSTVYNIQGPLGKGLDIQPDGTHIAFTGGTGILVFIDLVAHLIRKNLDQLDSNEEKQLRKGFTFILYVSFPK